MTKASFIIVTKNRPEKLSACLSSVSKIRRNLKKHELLIVDQGTNDATKLIVQRFRNQGIKIGYFRLRNSGVSRGRNFGMQVANSPLIAFIDDDCIFTNKYFTALAKLKVYRLTSQKVAMVFGPTLAYQPHKHSGLEYASVFPTKSADWRDYGSGNNMIISKKYFKKIGRFKTWLGKGSGGYSGEDREFALNCLRKGYQISYQPNLLLYHNHWLSQGDYVIRCRYYCGGIAAYAYHYFLGSQECLPYLRQYLRWTKWAVKENLKGIMKKPLKTLFSSLVCLYLGVKGLALGFYYARIAVNENRH